MVESVVESVVDVDAVVVLVVVVVVGSSTQIVTLHKSSVRRQKVFEK